MKKERAIIIKNQRLRKVRNELRSLLGIWMSNITSALRDKFWSESDNHKSKECNKEISNLKLAFEQSICYCRLCGKSDQDMIYIPTEKEWICLRCNSDRVYFQNLKDEILIHLSMEDIEEFLDRLIGDEGIGMTRLGSKCHGYEASRTILDKMCIKHSIQEKLLELCYYYGGHCDCEIIFNARHRLLLK